jgi:hypothetical protein
MHVKSSPMMISVSGKKSSSNVAMKKNICFENATDLIENTTSHHFQ